VPSKKGLLGIPIAVEGTFLFWTATKSTAAEREVDDSVDQVDITSTFAKRGSARDAKLFCRCRTGRAGPDAKDARRCIVCLSSCLPPWGEVGTLLAEFRLLATDVGEASI
jgi:hypothetical protein